MNRNEKILLLELILRDIRGYWGCGTDGRTDRALKLARELNFKKHIKRLNEYVEWEHNDGRFFRYHYSHGGYEDMSELHGLEYTIKDKSVDFQKQSEILVCPEYRFDDWDKYDYDYLKEDD